MGVMCHSSDLELQGGCKFQSESWVKSWIENKRDVGVIVEFASKKEFQKAMFGDSSQL